jgi:hypothetical protein
MALKAGRPSTVRGSRSASVRRTGEHTRLAAVTPVLPVHARGRAFQTGPVADAPQKLRRAFATLSAGGRRSTPALNNLGVVQLHKRQACHRRPPASSRGGRRGRHQPDTSSTWATPTGSKRDTQAAICWLRETLRHDPTTATRTTSASPSAQQGTRASRLAEELAAVVLDLRGLGQTFCDRPGSPWTQRIKSDDRTAATGSSSDAGNNQARSAGLARFYLDRARRLVLQRAIAKRSMNQSRLFLSPYDAGAPAPRTGPPSRRTRARGDRRAEHLDLER